MVKTNLLVGKNVVIQMRDGFKKAAFLVDFQTTFITIRFQDGRTEVLMLDRVAKITEDLRGRP
jgi:hypothetical protein